MELAGLEPATSWVRSLELLRELEKRYVRDAVADVQPHRLA